MGDRDRSTTPWTPKYGPLLLREDICWGEGRRGEEGRRGGEERRGGGEEGRGGVGKERGGEGRGGEEREGEGRGEMK